MRYRYHYRSLLLAASVLMAATGFGFALLTDFWPLLLVALVGTLNPSSGDVSVFLPLEHAVLVARRRRPAAHRDVRALQPGGLAARRRGIARGGAARDASSA